MDAVANGHGGPSANPSAASFYGEREYDGEKIRPDLTQTTILDGPLLAAKRPFLPLLHKKARRWPYQRVPFHMAEGGKITARSAWKEFAELRQSNLCCCQVVTLSPIGRCQRVRAALSFAQQLQHEIVGREGDSLIGRFVVHTLGFETAARPEVA
jgi:hypothetical protein